MNQPAGANDTVGTWAGSLQVLVARGLRAGTFIDVGSADGYHGLAVHATGLLPGAQIASIDANPLYEPTLRRVHAAIGGQYRICAVSDRAGSLEVHRSAHPYWLSGAAAGDAYWDSINELRGETTTVPCQTLDALVAEMGLPAPFVLKLDIQGLEAAALRGAAAMLKQTAVLICEMLLPEFDSLNSLLTAAGFALFDVTNPHRTQSQALGWFDGVYLHRDFAQLGSARGWADEHNAAVVQLQDERRRAVLAGIDSLLARVRR